MIEGESQDEIEKQARELASVIQRIAREFRAGSGVKFLRSNSETITLLLGPSKSDCFRERNQALIENARKSHIFAIP